MEGGRASATHSEGRPAEAQADYRQVLEYDPRNEYAYFDLGVIAHTEGDVASVVSDYRIALTIHPDFVPAPFDPAIPSPSP